MYVCGPTVYDLTHVGHARTYVAFDIIRRFFEYLGYEVKYVVNITDIDDKIINRALEEGRSWKEIAETYTEDFFRVLKILNIKPANHYPKVTEYVSEIVNIIQDLVRKEYAYVADDGSVYFSVSKIPDYGILSKQKLEKLIAGARVEPSPYKRNPLDFALWKAWKPKEPWWSSPWGPGRPGWHIECVAMATRCLGPLFDIHGGGQDLVFPHHENEIAIAKAHLGGGFAKYWLHTGLVTIRGEKMSKSLGNIIPVYEVTKKYDPEALRLYLASVHYRKPLDFKYEGLEQCSRILETLYTAHDYLKGILGERELTSKDLTPPKDLTEKEGEVLEQLERLKESFERHMCEDFNTPRALSDLIKIAKLCINLVTIEEKLSNYVLTHAYKVLVSLSEVFGVLSRREPPVNLRELVYELVDLILEVRSKLREKREWELADSIRSKLNELGILLNDARTRTLWKWRR